MSGEWVTWIILLLGFVFSGLYQKRKIDALDAQLKTQNDLIDSLKKYSDIVDVKRLKELVSFSEEAIQRKKEAEIAQLQAEFGEKVRMIEREKDERLSDARKKSDIDKGSFLKRIWQRIYFSYRYRIIILVLEKLIMLQSSLLLYADMMFASHGIRIGDFSSVRKEAYEIYDIFSDIMNNFDSQNFVRLDIDLGISDAFENFDHEKYNLRLELPLFNRTLI